jgi:UDP-N-acetylmuramate dehydrogenase
MVKMNPVKEHHALFEYNTFHVHAAARFFVELTDIPSVKEFVKSDLLRNQPFFVLGGGSNVLFTRDFDGVIIRSGIMGMEIIQQDASKVLIKVGAGEEWDGLVAFCVKNEWGGIENLSMIPGLVGACPVQNIGAYGVEVKDHIDSVEGYFLSNGKKFILKAGACQFSYRNSIFKNELKNKVIITHVNFWLHKDPVFNTSYPDFKNELDQYDDTNLGSIRAAIKNIRSIKLPDPAETGNAGSFFKNPIVKKEQVDNLLRFYPSIPVYRYSDECSKLSAAWLIEQTGWKGKIFGNTGTHKKQPLIIINRGGATGQEILECALKIQNAVLNHFAIKLEMEVNIL